MSEKSTIEINFENAAGHAAAMKELAGELKGIADAIEKYDEENQARFWKGDAGDAFYDKLLINCETIRKHAKDLEKYAGMIETMVGRLESTEQYLVYAYK